MSLRIDSSIDWSFRYCFIPFANLRLRTYRTPGTHMYYKYLIRRDLSVYFASKFQKQKIASYSINPKYAPTIYL